MLFCRLRGIGLSQSEKLEILVIQVSTRYKVSHLLKAACHSSLNWHNFGIKMYVTREVLWQKKYFFTWPNHRKKSDGDNSLADFRNQLILFFVRSNMIFFEATLLIQKLFRKIKFHNTFVHVSITNALKVSKIYSAYQTNKESLSLVFVSLFWQVSLQCS